MMSRETMHVAFMAEDISEASSAMAFARRCRSISRELCRWMPDVAVIGLDLLDSMTEPSVAHAHFPDAQRPRPVQRSSFAGRFVSYIAIARFWNMWLRAHQPKAIVLSLRNPILSFVLTLRSRISTDNVILDIQDSWLYAHLAHRGVFRNRTRRFLEGMAVRIAGKVTTVTPTLRSIIASGYRVSERKIRVVHNGADPPSARTPTEKTIDFIHLGSPRIHYDTMTLVSALHELAEANIRPSIVFLGYVEDWYGAEVRSAIFRMGLDQHVQFVAPVPPSEVPAWLAKSRCGLFSLRRDPISECAIGVKVFEYLASGLPVIHLGPERGETAMLLVSTGSGLVSSTSADFAGAMKRFLGNSNLQNEMSAAARIAAARFTWAASALQMKEAIEA